MIWEERAKDCQVTEILWENRKEIFSMLVVFPFVFFNVTIYWSFTANF